MPGELLRFLVLTLGLLPPALAADPDPARLERGQQARATSPVHFVPAELLLGELAVGERGALHRVQMRNSGKERARLAGWSVVGDASIDTDCGPALEPGSQCELRLRFTPSSFGARRATVLVLDESHGEVVALGVSARGVAAGASTLAANGSNQRRRAAPPRARRRRAAMNSPRTRPATPSGRIPSPPAN